MLDKLYSGDFEMLTQHNTAALFLVACNHTTYENSRGASLKKRLLARLQRAGYQTRADVMTCGDERYTMWANYCHHKMNDNRRKADRIYR
jgi:hypothetical protein